MLGPLSTNDAFDVPFFVLSGLGLLTLLAGAIRAPALSSRGVAGFSLLALVLATLLPLAWNVVWPAKGGIEGAARILFGSPSSAAAVLVLSVLLFRSPSTSVSRGRAVGGALAQLLCAAAVWLYFLFA